MSAPKFHTFAILCLVNRDSAASLLFPQRVAHHSDRLHRTLMICILRLDRYNAPLVVCFLMRIWHTGSLVLLDYLLAGVQNNVEKFGFAYSDLRFV